MKKYLFLIFSCAFLTGCATLDPVYEKLNAQVAAMRNLAGISTTQTKEKEYFFVDTYLLCGEKAKEPHVEVLFGESFEVSSGKIVTKPGMIGMQWDGEKPVWTKPEKLSANTFRLVFPGKKPMLITQTRVRNLFAKNHDCSSRDLDYENACHKDQYDPYIEIRLGKGKVFECSESFH